MMSLYLFLGSPRHRHVVILRLFLRHRHGSVVATMSRLFVRDESPIRDQKTVFLAFAMYVRPN